MKKLISFFSAASLFLAACQSNQTGTPADGANTVIETKTETKATSTDADQKRYKPEKGLIEYNYSMAGMKGVQTLKFRNYGEEEMRVVVMDMMGKKMNLYSLRKGGYLYSWGEGMPNAIKMKIPADQNINYRNIPDSIRERFKIEEAGTETFLGKTAKTFKIKDATTGMNGSTAVWEGIPLRSVVQMQGNMMEFTATKIDENPSFTDKDFELPANISFTER